MRLNVSVVNPRATVSEPHRDPVLFTGDGASNTLTVTLENGGDAPLPLSQGPAASYAAVSIFFGSLLAPGQAEGLHVDAAQWDSHWDDGHRCWQLTPDTPGLELDPATSLTIAITGWPAFPTTTHGQLTVQWTNFGTAKGALPFVVMVLRSAGAAARLRDDVTLELAEPPAVAVGDSPTTLTLRLANAKPEPLVSPGAPGHPRFTLLLACLPEPSDQTLTTCSLAQAAQLAPRAPYAGLWQAGVVDDQTSPPSWPLTPLTPQVLDASAAVDFELSQLKIPAPPGQGPLYLMYTGVTGYDDGYLRLPIDKQTPVLAIGQPVLSAPSLGAAETLDVSWPTSGAVAGTIRLRDSTSPPVALTVAADGTLACELYSNDDMTLTVRQGNEELGTLTLPADAVKQLNVTMDAAVQDAHGKTAPAAPIDLRLEAPKFVRVNYHLVPSRENPGTTEATQGLTVAHAFGVTVLMAPSTSSANWDSLGTITADNPGGYLPPAGWTPRTRPITVGNVNTIAVTLIASGYGRATTTFQLTLEAG